MKDFNLTSIALITSALFTLFIMGVNETAQSHQERAEATQSASDSLLRPSKSVFTLERHNPIKEGFKFVTQKPDRIVFHETANIKPWANAEFHAEYIDTTDRKVIWHYTVDDTKVIQHLSPYVQGWHASTKGNKNSIGVEVCQNEGQDTTALMRNVRALGSMLRKEFPGIRISSHRDETGKNCPNTGRLIEFVKTKNK